MRRVIVLLAVLALCLCASGCDMFKSTYADPDQNVHRLKTIWTDFRLFQRDIDVVLGLNRNCFNEVYVTPNYMDTRHIGGF